MAPLRIMVKLLTRAHASLDDFKLTRRSPRPPSPRSHTQNHTTRTATSVGLARGAATGAVRRRLALLERGDVATRARPLEMQPRPQRPSAVELSTPIPG